MKSGIFSRIGVYGWDEIEAPLLASIAGGLTIILMGETGSGKTYAHGRITEAFRIAYTHHKISPIRPGEQAFRRTKLSGHSSPEDDIIGWDIPPSSEDIQRIIDEGGVPTMNQIFSEQGIAFSNTIMVDEVTRIPEHFQNLYLPVLDEERELRGMKVPAEFIWGTANPLGYSGTSAMDPALANRFCLIVPIPAGNTMRGLIKRNAYSVLAFQKESEKISVETCLELYDTIHDARTIHKTFQENGTLDMMLDYVIAMEETINASISKNSSSTNSVRPLDTRRCNRILRSMSWMMAVRMARGEEGTMMDDALSVFLMSMTYPLTDEAQRGSSFFPVKINEAHNIHSSLLQSEQERLLSKIMREEDPVNRLALSFNSSFDTANERSQFLREAIDATHVSGPDEELAFCSTFMEAYVNRKTAKLTVDTSALDLIVSRVSALIVSNEEISMSIPLNFGKGCGLQIQAIESIKNNMQNENGRQAIKIVELCMGEINDTNVVQFTNRVGRTHKKLIEFQKTLSYIL